MKKTTTRTLQESSWLAQILVDMMEAESDNSADMFMTTRWHCLHTMLIIVREADNSNNSNIYYDNCNGKRRIIICDIPSMIMEYGMDYDAEGMASKLRGLAENYKDEDGQYIVDVRTTHDLNTATITDLSELMFLMNC